MDRERIDRLAVAFGSARSRRGIAKVGLAGLAAAGFGRRAFAVGAQEATPAVGAAGCAAASPEANLAVARRWFEDATNGHDPAVADEILAPAPTQRAAPFPDTRDPRAILGAILRGFPDIQVTVEDAFAAGDKAVVRYTATGTHLGEFLGVPPSGRTATWTGIHLFRLECGRIAEMWGELDALGRLRQIGGIPGSGSPAAGTPAP